MNKALFKKNELLEIKETLQVIKTFIDNLQKNCAKILPEIEDLASAFNHLEDIQNQISSNSVLPKRENLGSLPTTKTKSLLSYPDNSPKSQPQEKEQTKKIESSVLSLSAFNQFLFVIKNKKAGKIAIGRSRKDFQCFGFFLYPRHKADLPELISRKHAGIFFRENQFFIKDYDSTHGTFVNGHRIQADEYIPFDSGDTIRFAKSRVLTFVPSLFRLKDQTTVN